MKKDIMFRRKKTSLGHVTLNISCNLRKGVPGKHTKSHTKAYLPEARLFLLKPQLSLLCAVVKLQNQEHGTPNLLSLTL